MKKLTIILVFCAIMLHGLLTMVFKGNFLAGLFGRLVILAVLIFILSDKDYEKKYRIPKIHLSSWVTIMVMISILLMIAW